MVDEHSSLWNAGMIFKTRLQLVQTRLRLSKLFDISIFDVSESSPRTDVGHFVKL